MLPPPVPRRLLHSTIRSERSLVAMMQIISIEQRAFHLTVLKHAPSRTNGGAKAFEGNHPICGIKTPTSLTWVNHSKVG